MSHIEDSIDNIRRFIDERQRSKNLQFQRHIEDSERLLKENDSYYRKLIQRIESRGKVIQEKVKEVKEQYINLCKLLQKEHAKILRQHKDILSKKFKKFHSDFQKYRQTITSESSVSMTDVEQQLSDFDMEVPALPQLFDFTFLENADPLNDVTSAFGLMSSGRPKRKPKPMVAVQDTKREHEIDAKNCQDQSDASTQTENNEWMLTEAIACSDEDTSELGQITNMDDNNSIGLLVPTEDQKYQSETKQEHSYCLRAVSNFKHSNAFTSLCATVDGAWIAFDRTKKIELVDLNGDVIKSVMASECVENICVSITSARLWVACSDNRIVEYQDDGTPGVAVSVPTRPCSLCVTPDNHVFVGSLGSGTAQNGGSISVYNTKGVKINNIRGVHVRPLRMTSHKRETIIAVVHGGYNVRNCVTVYNDQLEPQFTYHGTKKFFHPSDLCFHGDGNLFVCDSSTSSLLVFDALGNCLSTVSLASLSKPLVLSIDMDMLWVGYADSIVKVSRIDNL